MLGTQISEQPITRQQLETFGLAHVGQTTCSRPKQHQKGVWMKIGSEENDSLLQMMGRQRSHKHQPVESPEELKQLLAPTKEPSSCSLPED